MDFFPYGKAPFWILILSLCTGAGLLVSQRLERVDADLTLVVFATTHYNAYQKALPDLERNLGIKVKLQRVDIRALQARLQAALLSGSDVPDLVEIEQGNFGYFTKGPVEDMGFVDLTDRIHAENLIERMVESRYSLWRASGRIFALPHDVHPVVLAYRHDIVEGELGIDPARDLRTWEDFVRVGRRITKDLDGDGNPDRYMLDLANHGDPMLRLLLLQRDGALFDENGALVMDSEVSVETILWYLEQCVGQNRIAFSAGNGQMLYKAMMDGLVLFYWAPDWRTKAFEVECPQLKGKLKVMPVPVWEEGGRPTSTWGGTGMGITRGCKDVDKAWEVAKYLYLKKEDLAQRFNESNIVPPLREAWDLPELQQPNEFYAGQRLGKILAELAPMAPPDYSTPYVEQARNKLKEALVNSTLYYQKNEAAILAGEISREQLRAKVREIVRNKADYVRNLMAKNRFYQAGGSAADAGGGP